MRYDWITVYIVNSLRSDLYIDKKLFLTITGRNYSSYTIHLRTGEILGPIFESITEARLWIDKAFS